MQSTTYEFAARNKVRIQRPRLMSVWTLVGFAVAVLIPLVMIFPKQQLLRDAARGQLGDPLTISYLANLMRTNPNNAELRVLFAENKIYEGQLQDIPAILAPVLHGDDIEWQRRARLAEYKYLVKQFALAEDNAVQQAALLEQRRSVFAELAGYSWSTEDLLFLAGQAYELHQQAVAERLMRTVHQLNPHASAAWFGKAATRLLGEGDYEMAAQLYFMARQKAHAVADKRRYLMAGVNALMANEMFEQAMDAATKYLGDLRNDPETLYLLAKTAQAANDHMKSDRFARQLLHISWLDRAGDWLRRLDLNPIASACAAEDAPTHGAPDGMRPYDAKDYELAYKIFLGDNNIADAYRVAEAAVRQVPADFVWHKRLAQVAEWNHKPEIALREWRWLAFNGGGEEADLAVLRLAPALDDYDSLLAVWKRLAAHRKMSTEQWNTLSDLFEKTGRHKEGIKFFEDRYIALHQPALLEIAARLAERSGDDDLAQRLYFRLLKEQGFSTERVQKIANLYLRKGQYRQAYELMQKYRGKVDGKDAAYWKVMADLAWQLQHDDEAIKDYRRLASANELAKGDFSRLIYLLGDSNPDEVAALAELAYRKFDDGDMLLQALEIHAALHDLAAEKRLFESVDAKVAANLAGSYRFFLLRARYLQASGDLAGARGDLRHAVALAPQDADSITALLWFMIDLHDLSGVRATVAQIDLRGDQENPAYWGVLAAACQVLDQPSRAVAFYARQLKRNGQDFLWLVNYADALEQDRQAGMALRVRRHAWLQLRARLQDKPLELPFSPDMLAAARLALMNQPGDPGQALVRSVLRQDRLLKQDAAADQQTSDLVLGWIASNERSANAKAWLWQRYGSMLTRPLWAETMVAMADNDTARLDRLLAEQADGMSMLSRHDVARALGRTRYAESIVFEGLTADPDNNEAQQRLTEDALDTASSVELEMRSERLGTVHDNVVGTRIETPVASNMRVAAEFRQTREANDVPSVYGNAPSSEQVSGLALKLHDKSGDTELALRRRNEFAQTTEARLTYSTDIVPRLHVRLNAEMHADANESTDLRMFGMRNEIDAALRYGLSKRDYLAIQPGYARYYLQSGERLGSGRLLSWEVGHAVRAEYPDWIVRVIGSHTRFNADGATGLPLPNDTNLYGLCFGYGESLGQAYTHAWRPHFAYCATNNDVSGRGYNAGFGLAGALAGHDRLALDIRQELGGTNVADGLTRVMTVNYRYFFD
jgi:polysaccharide biosynthesis protein PelB